MITPDGGGREQRRAARSRGGLIGAAALVVFGGLIAVGALTTTSPDAVATSSTTTTTTADEIEPPIDPENFSVAQIARGEPLAWEPTLSTAGGYPLAITDYEEEIYLFSTQVPDFSSHDTGGLRVWKSAEGVDWQLIGEVIPAPREISAVTATQQGLIALESSDGSGFTIWRSADGIEWIPEEVGDATGESWAATIPLSAGGTNDLLVVAGERRIRVADLIEERLGTDLDETIDQGPYGWSTDVYRDQIRFTLYGPIGMPLMTVDATELGLSERDRELITEWSDGVGPGPAIWFDNGSGWKETRISDAVIIQGIIGTQDGRVVAIGYGQQGLAAWSTTDGLDWESVPAFPSPYRIDDWGDRLVGPSISSGASVLISGEDDGWSEIGPAPHFPDHLDWSIRALGAGPGGVATIVTGWSREQPAPGDPPTLTYEDATLTLDFRSGQYMLDSGGDTYTWSMGGDVPGGLEANLAEATLSFHEPESGVLLGTFDFEDINRTANAYWSGQGARGNVQAFAFTDDSFEWTIQDTVALERSDGNAPRVELALLEVTHSHVIAVTLSGEGNFAPTSSPGFEVWSAEIP